jgi:hypothetical protein
MNTKLLLSLLVLFAIVALTECAGGRRITTTHARPHRRRRTTHASTTHRRRHRRRRTTHASTTHRRRHRRRRTTHAPTSSTSTTTARTTTVPARADAARSDICVTQFGACSTYYSPQCICVG